MAARISNRRYSVESAFILLSSVVLSVLFVLFFAFLVYHCILLCAGRVMKIIAVKRISRRI